MEDSSDSLRCGLCGCHRKTGIIHSDNASNRCFELFSGHIVGVLGYHDSDFKGENRVVLVDESAVELSNEVLLIFKGKVWMSYYIGFEFWYTILHHDSVLIPCTEHTIHVGMAQDRGFASIKTLYDGSIKLTELRQVLAYVVYLIGNEGDGPRRFFTADSDMREFFFESLKLSCHPNNCMWHEKSFSCLKKAKIIQASFCYFSDLI